MTNLPADTGSPVKLTYTIATINKIDTNSMIIPIHLGNILFSTYIEFFGEAIRIIYKLASLGYGYLIDVPTF